MDFLTAGQFAGRLGLSRETVRRLAIADVLPCTVVCRGSRKTTRRYPRRFADDFAASGQDVSDLAEFAARWRAQLAAAKALGQPRLPVPFVSLSHVHDEPAPVRGLAAQPGRSRRGLADGPACRGADPDLFFPLPGESADPARAICAACAVRTDCLALARARGEQFGIWGGVDLGAEAGTARSA